MAYAVHTNMKIWDFWIIYVVTNSIADNFYVNHIPGWLKLCAILEDTKILKIILYATFLWVWCMWYTIPLMLKEFFQAFSRYIHDFMMNWYLLLLSLCVSTWKPFWCMFLYLNSVWVELGYRSVSSIDNWVPIGKINVPRPKINWSQYRSIRFVWNFLYSLWEFGSFNSPEYSVSGVMSTKWIPFLIWIIPVG